MLIIALSGRKGSGKTTVAKYLVNKYEFHRTPLANKLKLIVKKEFNLVHPKDIPDYGKPDINKKVKVKTKDVIDKLLSYIDLPKDSILDNEKLQITAVKIAWYINQYHEFQDEVQKSYSARKVYQLVGTDFFRTINETIWIDYLIKDIEHLIENGKSKFVIDDLRFLNEYQILKEKFKDEFNLWYIEPKTKNETFLENVNDNHISETYFEEIKQVANIVLENEYDFDKFSNQVDELIYSCLSKSLK